jgi:hypothetical protein
VTADSRGHDGTDWDPAWTATPVRMVGGWQVAITIPFKAITAVPPVAGEVWGANFCRNFNLQKDGKTVSSASSSWAGVTGTFHQPEMFGYLIFQ